MITSYIHWAPDPELINIFGLSIRYYGLFWIIGLILSIYALRRVFKHENLPTEKIIVLSTYAIIGIQIGARVGHCLFYEPEYYLSNPMEILLPVKFLDEGGFRFTGYHGLASHGGGIGFVIGMILYARRDNFPVLYILDLVAIVGSIACGFIRLANLMNSEIIGVPTTKAWGFIFQNVDKLPRHPTQLYEAISFFLIFFIMVYLFKTKRESLRNGYFTGLVLVLAFTCRFFIEFIKERLVLNSEDTLLSMGQILSIPFILLGISLMLYGRWKTEKENTLSEIA